jgi:hypothetical protein
VACFASRNHLDLGGHAVDILSWLDLVRWHAQCEVVFDSIRQTARNGVLFRRSDDGLARLALVGVPRRNIRLRQSIRQLLPGDSQRRAHIWVGIVVVADGNKRSGWQFEQQHEAVKCARDSRDAPVRACARTARAPHAKEKSAHHCRRHVEVHLNCARLKIE